MVSEETKFDCPQCFDQFDTYDECVEHIRDDHTEDPEEVTIYVCEECHDEYNSWGEADDCEVDHKSEM